MSFNIKVEFDVTFFSRWKKYASGAPSFSYRMAVESSVRIQRGIIVLCPIVSCRSLLSSAACC